MQPIANIPKKPNNRTRTILLGVGVGMLICCLGGAAFIAVIRAASPSAAALPTTAKVPSGGGTVVFNVPTKTPEPTDTPKPAPLGETRDEPFPVDAVVNIGGGMQLSIVFVTRPADEIVGAGNMFNDTPEPNLEYLLVALHVDCTKPTNETCNFTTYEIKTVGADGQVHDQAFVAGIPNEMESSSEFFGGAHIEGSMVFLATKGDTSNVLFYDPLIFGDPVYIALK